MKFKYYLRGAGCGIIFSTLVLMIAFSLHKTDEKILNDTKPNTEISEEEPADTSEATHEEDSKDINEQTESEVTDEAPESLIPEEAVLQEKTEVEEYKPFYVEKGQSSNQVSISLEEQGFIDNADSFNKYLVEIGVSDKIQPGSFYIKQGSEYDDIAALLVTKPEHRADLPAVE
ncbi:MAG: endolytic transglycosylase MltG [Pseudobutyrivibrio sp.]|nr:endolytic transglycosylase MltG [Pseudobutyrivibrio sp.]